MEPANRRSCIEYGDSRRPSLIPSLSSDTRKKSKLFAAAERGNHKAQFQIGYKYATGDNVVQNYKKAYQWYFKSALSGNSKAMLNIGVLYERGNGVDQNYTKAAEWFARAAENGQELGYYNLGILYYRGSGLNTDYKKAYECFMKIADKNYSDAQYHIGILYHYGYGLTQNHTLAAEWYAKALATDGNVDARISLGILFYNGLGVEQDHHKAFELLREPAEDGDEEAQYYVGLLYKDRRDSRASYDNMFKWHLKSAKQGYSDAQNSVGMFYQHGLGVEQSDRKALAWFQRAAESNNAIAQNNVGSVYHNGLGVERNYRRAIEWYTKSAKNGNLTAQYNLGTIYETGGYGIDIDIDMAIYWYTKASEQGDKEAQYKLGQIHERGRGTPKNYRKAIRYYIDASKNESIPITTRRMSKQLEQENKVLNYFQKMQQKEAKKLQMLLKKKSDLESINGNHKALEQKLQEQKQAFQKYKEETEKDIEMLKNLLTERGKQGGNPDRVNDISTWVDQVSYSLSKAQISDNFNSGEYMTRGTDSLDIARTNINANVKASDGNRSEKFGNTRTIESNTPADEKDEWSSKDSDGKPNKYNNRDHGSCENDPYYDDPNEEYCFEQSNKDSSASDLDSWYNDGNYDKLYQSFYESNESELYNHVIKNNYNTLHHLLKIVLTIISVRVEIEFVLNGYIYLN
ncbi:HCP-like protein [Backusella circina FSU 941]|nr:HCP-like protein [Backusella circina FSU 941]